MKVGEILDLDNLCRRIREGYIVERFSDERLLWNYTAKAQYEHVWDNETRRCRGLVGTLDGTLVARPFEKFFNVGEHESLPQEPFEVYEKLDGSLIVVAQGPNGLSITSRGSFDSAQSLEASRLWSEKYCDVTVPDGQTWCFELIAPWNRIVVDYGETEDLCLLAAFDNTTGLDVACPDWHGPRVRTYDFTSIESVVEMLSSLGPNDEGYVLRFASGLRVKAKGAEYVRLHRLITGLSARGIWEVLSTGGDISQLVERVPDEFNDWVRQTIGNLARQHDEIRDLARSRHNAIMDLPTRKEQALAIADFPHKAVVFRMLDAKPYDDVIWRSIYPEAERPFRQLTSEDL